MKTNIFLEDEPPPEIKRRPPWATKIDWPVCSAIILIHIIGIPYLVIGLLNILGVISFGSVGRINIILFFILYCIMGLGITMGFHRYFTHHSFKTKEWIVYALAIAGHLAVQGPLIEWVRKHRAHHANTDVKDVDPHTPRNRFWWAHYGWNLFKDPEGKNWMVNVKDLEKNSFLVFISRFFWVPQCILIISLLSFGFFYRGFWMGIGLVCTDVAAVACVLNATWSINSICHMKVWLKTWWGKWLGKRKVETDDDSIDSHLVAFLTFGEGYHWYHHVDENSAQHGTGRFYYDPTYWGIRLLERLGLASDVRGPRKLAL